MAKNKEKNPVVLQILPELNQGGVELGTIEIASELQKKGIQNFVASEGGRMAYQLDRMKVKHFTLPLKTKNPFKWWLNYKRLVKIIKENGINIVHARSRAPAWSAYWAAKKTGAKFLTTFHGTYGLKPRWLKLRYNRVMTYGDLVIAISNHIKEHIIKNYGCDESKIRLVYRCVNMDNFDISKMTAERMIKLMEEYHLPEDKKIILLIGRLTRWKGQRLMIDALEKIQDKDFFCVFVGDDQGRTYYTNELKEAIESKGMAGRFAFIRHITDVPALMMVSDVVVSASLDPEAFGRIAAEGEAMGRIVVASDIGGSLENIKDGITGKHFKAGDADSLAEALTWALDLPEAERKKIGEAAINFVKENFTKQIMCDKTLAVYHELVNMD
ncbi:MAG: glycosyltransferase family 4 protein [Alphaproteobacteria bacterium]|nr:glycosyltransferase family 4 protein [Alphaproteobacteria bacterium]